MGGFVGICKAKKKKKKRLVTWPGQVKIVTDYLSYTISLWLIEVDGQKTVDQSEIADKKVSNQLGEPKRKDQKTYTLRMVLTKGEMILRGFTTKNGN